MSAGVHVRVARDADVVGILDLERLFPGDRMSRASVRRFLRVSTARVLVATHERQVVAALVLLFRKNSAWARIYSVIVDPSMRGQGIASRLIARAEREARTRACHGMTLEVRHDNIAARELYRRLGYDERRVLPDYYQDGASGLRLCRRFPTK